MLIMAINRWSVKILIQRRTYLIHLAIQHVRLSLVVETRLWFKFFLDNIWEWSKMNLFIVDSKNGFLVGWVCWNLRMRVWIKVSRTGFLSALFCNLIRDIRDHSVFQIRALNRTFFYLFHILGNKLWFHLHV